MRIEILSGVRLTTAEPAVESQTLAARAASALSQVEPVQLQPVQRQIVFALVVATLDRRGGISRTELGRLLYPGTDDAHRRSRVNVQISRLRKKLGDGRIRNLPD